MGQVTYIFSSKHKTILNVFLGMLLVYLSFHLFVSQRSIPSLLSLSIQESRMESQISNLSQEYASLTDKVIRLRPETIDPDMVEEYSIKMLGYGSSQGIILLDAKS